MSRSGLVSACVLLLAVAVAAAESPPAPPAQDDLGTVIEVLKQRNRDLERRLTELEGKIGEGADAQRLRREEVKAIVEQMLADAKGTWTPDWLDNLKFAGDLRLRYEYRDRTSNDQRDARARVRLRFGFVKKWPAEDLEIGFRLVSGVDDPNPTSTNDTLSPMFQEHGVGFDRAYAKWTPKAVKGLSVVAGKMANPWETTNLVWDTDVNPDGVWVDYVVPGLGDFEPFVGAGAFQLYNHAANEDAGLFAYDAGVRVKLAKDARYTVAATFFNFTSIDSAFANVAGARSANVSNTFGEFCLTNKVDFVALKTPMEVFVDWVHNTRDDAPQSSQDDGLAIGLAIGKNKKKGDWSFRYIWRHLETDAAVAYFTDSDFGWNTQTNRRGSELGLTYNITDAMTAGITFFVTEPINAANDEHRFTMQADLVWKF